LRQHIGAFVSDDIVPVSLHHEVSDYQRQGFILSTHCTSLARSRTRCIGCCRSERFPPWHVRKSQSLPVFPRPALTKNIYRYGT
jgi:hypothetical protein